MTPENILRPYHAIYAVIMGAALHVATTRVMEQFDAANPPAPPRLIIAALVVFVLTAIAFFEGTNEHWRENHSRISSFNESLTYFDCLCGVGHALFFTGAGYFITSPGRFAWAFVWLLMYDVVASFTLSSAYRLYKPANQCRGYLKASAIRPMRWAVINLIALISIFAIGLAATGRLDLRSWLLDVPKDSDGDWSSPGARVYYGFILVSVVRVGIDHWQSHKIRRIKASTAERVVEGRPT